MQELGINRKDQAMASHQAMAGPPELESKIRKAEPWADVLVCSVGGGGPGQGPGQRQRQLGHRVTRRPEGLAWLWDSWEAEDIPQPSHAGHPRTPWCHGLELN